MTEHRRLECSGAPRLFSQPRWNGERIEGRTLLIHREQGLGDALQFARYASLARAQSGAQRVILEAPPELARLLAYNLGGQAEIVSRPGSEAALLPPFDYQVPLLSLPLALRLFDPLAMTRGYIRADPELRRAWRERLGPPAGIRIGLVWAGSPDHQSDRIRSMRPESFLPLLGRPGFQFYSLQVGLASGRAKVLIDAGMIDYTAHIADFADTAALVAELDLIISVDTAVAHLAGAMGRPVWTLLSFQGEWRWGTAEEETLWYPTMRLWRQETAGDWDGVVQPLAAELKRGKSCRFRLTDDARDERDSARL